MSFSSQIITQGYDGFFLNHQAVGTKLPLAAVKIMNTKCNISPDVKKFDYRSE